MLPSLYSGVRRKVGIEGSGYREKGEVTTLRGNEREGLDRGIALGLSAEAAGLRWAESSSWAAKLAGPVRWGGKWPGPDRL